jgi:hypothetical protein
MNALTECTSSNLKQLLYASAIYTYIHTCENVVEKKYVDRINALINMNQLQLERHFIGKMLEALLMSHAEILCVENHKKGLYVIK